MPCFEIVKVISEHRVVKQQTARRRHALPEDIDLAFGFYIVLWPVSEEVPDSYSAAKFFGPFDTQGAAICALAHSTCRAPSTVLKTNYTPPALSHVAH